MPKILSSVLLSFNQFGVLMSSDLDRSECRGSSGL